ncbi:5-carboxymethyl-2-hydroxymuconate Delta-isomerase [Streptomyces apricus]|uniref:Isomerase n=1 Tax=Streptomyces apricus TaxID=1828112 RepID=A0A5B0AQE4_9ACTN|nr:isomerase [Streptomyces apricus]KAA0931907.1 isomerase [Streptomyces apricus]
MPQITVDYSAPLAEGFDRQGFAVALHAVVVETAAAKSEACKSRFRAVDDVVVGAQTAGHALVHVSLALLPGRSDEVKSALTSRTLELVRAYVKPVDGVALHASAEVRDLEPSYQKFVD